MKKILYFDTETTGLNPLKNEIHQLAIIIEVDGKIKFEGEFKIRPMDVDNISEKALSISGVTEHDILKYPHPAEQYKSIIEVFSQVVDRFDKDDKFYPAGYNVKFDLEFLYQFFLKNDDKFFGSWINWMPLDPLPVLHAMDFKNQIKLSNYKLATACQYYDIKLDNAHDAMADIKATRELLKKMNLV